MQRVHYDADHRAFAELAGDFAAKEVAPQGIRTSAVDAGARFSVEKNVFH